MNDMASIRKMRPVPGVPSGSLGCEGAGAGAAWGAGASLTAVAVVSCELGFLRGKKLVYQRCRWGFAVSRQLIPLKPKAGLSGAPRRITPRTCNRHTQVARFAPCFGR